MSAADVPSQFTAFAVAGLPLVTPGDDVAEMIITCLRRQETVLEAGDCLVIAQKIISKSENRYLDLAMIEPSAKALRLAALCAKDPRLVEVILEESNQVLRYRPGVLIVEHRLGVVMANAGIDQSNLAANAGDRVLLLPQNPDTSASTIQERLQNAFQVPVSVIINDSVGRAWRNGTVGIALGASGLAALQDIRGAKDLYGRPLRVSIVGLADELAAAASLLQGQGREAQPVVVIRGLDLPQGHGKAQDLLRPHEEDLFR